MGIEDLMRGAQNGRDDRGVTGLSLWHGAGSSDFFSAPLAPNGRFQPLQKAGATEERTLEAVGCKPVFGWVCPTPLAWQLMWSLCRGFLFENDPLLEPLFDVLA
jgi:hypothetical protein